MTEVPHARTRPEESGIEKKSALRIKSIRVLYTMEVINLFLITEDYIDLVRTRICDAKDSRNVKANKN